MSIAIIAALMIINMWVALTTFVILGGGYILIGYLLRQRIGHNSQIIAKNQPLAVKYMQEGLGGIRDVIVGGSQPVFSRLYALTVHRILAAQLQNILLGTLPKPVLEVLGITLIAVVAYVMQASSDGQVTALPVLGALALGAQRLLPSLQQVYFSWSSIKGSQAALADVCQYIVRGELIRKHQKITEVMPFKRSLDLRSVSFRYAGTDVWVLRDIDLSIPKGTRTVQNPVVLVDFDFHRPNIHKTLGFSPPAGVVDYLNDDVLISEVIYQVVDTDMFVIPGRDVEKLPMDLMSSDKVSRFHNLIKGMFPSCYIFYDMPPVIPVDDAVIFEDKECNLIVTAESQTSVDDLYHAMELLSGQNILGYVLNKSKSSSRIAKYGYSYYGYGGYGSYTKKS